MPGPAGGHEVTELVHDQEQAENRDDGEKLYAHAFLVALRRAAALFLPLNTCCHGISRQTARADSARARVCQRRVAV